jgi:peptidoglycan/LPS O-acetylase OafA/YrhL
VLLLGASARALLPHLLAGPFYLHGAIYGSENPVSAVTWSLEVEVQFYLLTPFWASAPFAIRRAWLRRATLVSVTVGSIARRE